MGLTAALESGMVVHTCNPSKCETGKEAPKSQDYRDRLSQKTKGNERREEGEEGSKSSNTR